MAAVMQHQRANFRLNYWDREHQHQRANT